MKLAEVIDEKYYHGSSREFKKGDYIIPPLEHGLEIQEKGRKKNLDKVFITKDIGSAKIYAGRAKNALGGKPVVYVVKPIGKIDTINTTKGTTVFSTNKAKIIDVINI